MRRFVVGIVCAFLSLPAFAQSPVPLTVAQGALAGAQALIEPELLALFTVIVFIGLVSTALVEHRHL